MTGAPPPTDPRPCWELWRQDDNGFRAMIDRFPTRAAAEERLRRFEALAHKQTYWIEGGAE